MVNLVLILLLILLAVFAAYWFATVPELVYVFSGRILAKTNYKGLDPMCPIISIDLKPSMPVSDYVTLFTIGEYSFTEHSPVSSVYSLALASKSGDIYFRRSTIGMSEDDQPTYTRQFSIAANLFDGNWHNIKTVINVATRKITIQIDKTHTKVLVDDMAVGTYPIDVTQSSAYIGGSPETNCVVGEIKNVYFGNKLKYLEPINARELQQTLAVNPRNLLATGTCSI